MPNMPESIQLREVGPRDGLQYEKQVLSVEDKLAFIDDLAKAGNRYIEAGSFVRPDLVPPMAGTAELAAELQKRVQAGAYKDITFGFLTMNKKGAENALETVDEHFGELATVVGISERFCKANMGVSNCDEAFDKLVAPVMELAKAHKVRVRGYVSTVFEGIPVKKDGEIIKAPDAVKVQDVVAATKRYLEMGAYEVSLGDTTGAGTPETTKALLDALKEAEVPFDKIALHFHDTGGKAIENVKVALRYNPPIRVFDAAAGGLGGCPFAGSPKGNLPTENLLALCEENRIEVGVDVKDVVRASHPVLAKVSKKSPSNIHHQVAQELGLNSKTNSADSGRGAA